MARYRRNLRARHHGIMRWSTDTAPVRVGLGLNLDELGQLLLGDELEHQKRVDHLHISHGQHISYGKSELITYMLVMATY